MSQYSILPQHNSIVSNNINYIIPMSSDPKLVNIHAIQIKDDIGHIEYLDNTPVNKDIQISDYQYLIDKVEAIKNAPTPTPTVDEVKKTTLDNITRGFNIQQTQGFVTAEGIKMNSAIWDIQTLLTILQIATTTNQLTLDLVDYNNVIHKEVPLAIVNNIVNELGKNYQTLFTRKQLLRQQVNDAKTIEELQNIVW